MRPILRVGNTVVRASSVSVPQKADGNCVVSQEGVQAPPRPLSRDEELEVHGRSDCRASVVGLCTDDHTGPRWFLQACPGIGQHVLKKKVLLPPRILKDLRRRLCPRL